MTDFHSVFQAHSTVLSTCSSAKGGQPLLTWLLHSRHITNITAKRWTLENAIVDAWVAFLFGVYQIQSFKQSSQVLSVKAVADAIRLLRVPSSPFALTPPQPRSDKCGPQNPRDLIVHCIKQGVNQINLSRRIKEFIAFGDQA
jgi:hypothetical protein